MANNKKKKNTNKLKSLILLLFLTVIMLSTSTYAWFTANRSVSIDPINVNVAATSGLQISTDAVNWKTLITNNDITGASWTGNINMLPSELAPVSTGGETDANGLLKFYSGAVDGNETTGAMELTATKCPDELKGTSADFIAFDIFLKLEDSSGDSVPIYLTNGSGVLPTTGYTSKGLEYAARYAFVIQGTVDSATAVDTVRGLKNASNVVVVEPNYDAHTAYGVQNASAYNLSTSQGEHGVPQVNYVGVKNAISSPITLVDTNPGGNPSSDYFTSLSNLMLTNVYYSEANETNKAAYIGTTAQAGLLPVFNIEPGITKIRVYMWVEGQDVDCENTASGAHLTYKLGFQMDDE